METVISSPRMAYTAVVILLCGFCLGLTAPATAAIQIYPLGDSITYGDFQNGHSYPSYRYWLWNDLKSEGYDVDFIGSQHGPDYGVTFDTDNDGHAGYTSARELAELPTWLPGLHPDIVLLHLGTNDVLEGVPQSVTLGNIGAIITDLRATNPQVKILLAQIIPTSVNKTNLKIVSLNTGIAGLQQQMNTAASPIILVDQYTGYDGEHDNQNGGVHPAETGEVKIATRWNAALVSLLSQPVIQPTVVVTTVTPTPVAPVVTATPQATSVPITGKGTGTFSASGMGFGTRFSPFSGNTAGGFSQVTAAGSSSVWGSSSFSSGWAPVGSSQPNQPFQKWSPPGLWARIT